MLLCSVARKLKMTSCFYVQKQAVDVTRHNEIWLIYLVMWQTLAKSVAVKEGKTIIWVVLASQYQFIHITDMVIHDTFHIWKSNLPPNMCWINCSALNVQCLWLCIHTPACKQADRHAHTYQQQYVSRSEVYLKSIYFKDISEQWRLFNEKCPLKRQCSYESMSLEGQMALQVAYTPTIWPEIVLC